MLVDQRARDADRIAPAGLLEFPDDASAAAFLADPGLRAPIEGVPNPPEVRLLSELPVRPTEQPDRVSTKGRTGERRPPSRAAAAQAFQRQFPGASASANAAVRALVKAYDDATRLANSALRHRQLSPSGRQALATIDGAGGSLSQSEVAERLLTTPASITSLIDTLERRGSSPGHAMPRTVVGRS